MTRTEKRIVKAALRWVKHSKETYMTECIEEDCAHFKEFRRAIAAHAKRRKP